MERVAGVILRSFGKQTAKHHEHQQRVYNAVEEIRHKTLKNKQRDECILWLALVNVSSRRDVEPEKSSYEKLGRIVR
jgi:hypothetical protein